MARIAIMHNTIQEYKWGSKSFIPALMGIRPLEQKPQAELWMGAHPKAPSKIIQDGVEKSLIDLFNESPEQMLGSSVARRFSDTIPFLLKIIAVDRPLSLQTHPNRSQAAIGFSRETKKNIPLDAAHRNYRDRNNKPELICALRPFSALKGFRKTEDILDLFAKIGNLPHEIKIGPLKDNPPSLGLKTFFHSLLTMDADLQKKIIYKIIRKAQSIESPDPSFRWMVRLYQEYPDDVGILSPILMNLVRLRPGEAIFIPPGELHAYLEGAGIEIMANSDNVLRGALTDKHIDIPELMRIMKFRPCKVDILKPVKTGKHEASYPAESEEFILSKISLKKGDYYLSHTERNVEIMICMKGSGSIIDLETKERIEISKGLSIIVPASVTRYELSGNLLIYKASVPPL
ncbi:MAG: mannose-6-phosphate isomerase, class I [Deltaproteobacteria bacterium]|nr:mannose-6-phosphate isomerase, class I [Deltaproteobacteria bacterium]